MYKRNSTLYTGVTSDLINMSRYYKTWIASASLHSASQRRPYAYEIESVIPHTFLRWITLSIIHSANFNAVALEI